MILHIWALYMFLDLGQASSLPCRHLAHSCDFVLHPLDSSWDVIHRYFKWHDYIVSTLFYKKHDFGMWFWMWGFNMIPIYKNMPYWARRPLGGLVLVTFIYVYGIYNLRYPYMGWLDLAPQTPLWVAPCEPRDPFMGYPSWVHRPFCGLTLWL